MWNVGRDVITDVVHLSSFDAFTEYTLFFLVYLVAFLRLGGVESVGVSGIGGSTLGLHEGGCVGQRSRGLGRRQTWRFLVSCNVVGVVVVVVVLLFSFVKFSAAQQAVVGLSRIIKARHHHLALL